MYFPRILSNKLGSLKRYVATGLYELGFTNCVYSSQPNPLDPRTVSTHALNSPSVVAFAVNTIPEKPSPLIFAEQPRNVPCSFAIKCNFVFIAAIA